MKLNVHDPFSKCRLAEQYFQKIIRRFLHFVLVTLWFVQQVRFEKTPVCVWKDLWLCTLQLVWLHFRKGTSKDTFYILWNFTCLTKYHNGPGDGRSFFESTPNYKFSFTEDFSNGSRQKNLSANLWIF